MTFTLLRDPVIWLFLLTPTKDTLPLTGVCPHCVKHKHLGQRSINRSLNYFLSNQGSRKKIFILVSELRGFQNKFRRKIFSFENEKYLEKNIAFLFFSIIKWFLFHLPWKNFLSTFSLALSLNVLATKKWFFVASLRNWIKALFKRL